MTRVENVELQERLRLAIEKSLCSRGFDATSYKALADEVGVSRAVVQYYYPRKMDFAIGFLEKLLAAAADVLGIEGYASGKITPLEAHRMGCLYYGFLLAEDGARPLLLDILKNRELTDELMSRHYEWALANIDPRRPNYDQRSEDAVVAWGGFYELMYHSAKQGRQFDIPSRLLPLIEAFIGEGDEVLREAYSKPLEPNLMMEFRARIL